MLVKHDLIKGGDLDNAIVVVDRPVSQQKLDELATLVAERAELEARLTQPLPPAEIADCGKRLKQGQDETEKLEERWLEISTALEEMGASSPA